MSETVIRKSAKRIKVVELTQYALLSALVIVMTVTPIGYINAGGLSITLCHLPVILAAVMLGAPGGAILGGVWGVTCLIKAYFAPPSPLEGLIFTDPVVSLLPRILAGVVAGLVFSAIAKKGTESSKVIGAGVAAISGCLVNTIGVLAAIYLLHSVDQGLPAVANAGQLLKLIWVAAAVNAPLEIAAAVVLAIPVSVAVRRAMRRV
ncbi:MAG: ECF transporter S component [Oscillospiraceae bacterium]|jgi:uncharacterized membrane protein|nr:ECF transporter S component [Oscillospiraceae bacterium]